MVTKLGYGKSTTSISAEEIQTFIDQIPTYQKNLSHYQQQGNRQLFEKLETLLEAIEKQGT